MRLWSSFRGLISIGAKTLKDFIIVYKISLTDKIYISCVLISGIKSQIDRKSQGTLNQYLINKYLILLKTGCWYFHLSNIPLLPNPISILDQTLINYLHLIVVENKKIEKLIRNIISFWKIIHRFLFMVDLINWYYYLK